MSRARLIGAVCLCFMLVTALTSGRTMETKRNLYKDAITAARSEIWQAINSGKCGSATAAIEDLQAAGSEKDRHGCGGGKGQARSTVL